MDHPVFVRVLERTGDLRGKSHRVVHGKLVLTVDPIPERLSLHERHHVEEEAVRLARIEQRQDVRMLEVGCRLDLGQESLGPDHRGQLGLEDLQRDLSLVFEVVGQVDRRHAALTELTLDGVAAF